MPKPGQRRNPGPSGNELGRAVNEAERRTWPTPTRSDSQGGPGNSGRQGGENSKTAVAAGADVPDADRDQHEGRAQALGGSAGEELRDHWAAEPAVGRVADGVPHRVDRLAALGNALVPQIAEWIGRRILEYERAERSRREAVS